MLSGIKRRHEEDNETAATLKINNTCTLVKRRCIVENVTIEVFQNNVAMETEEEHRGRTANNFPDSKFMTTCPSSNPNSITQRCLRCEAGEPGHIRHILQ